MDERLVSHYHFGQKKNQTSLFSYIDSKFACSVQGYGLDSVAFKWWWGGKIKTTFTFNPLQRHIQMCVPANSSWQLHSECLFIPASTFQIKFGNHSLHLQSFFFTTTAIRALRICSYSPEKIPTFTEKSHEKSSKPPISKWVAEVEMTLDISCLVSETFMKTPAHSAETADNKDFQNMSARTRPLCRNEAWPLCSQN